MRLSFKTVTNVVVVLPRGRTRSIINFTLFPTITSNLVLHPLLRTPKTPSFHSSLSSPMSSHKVRDNIQLSDVEKRIFDRLLATLRFFNLQTHLRVAGGWVRDKLLGKECYDIDIALDKMMGTEFVDKVREYLLSIGEEAQGVCVIESNPDQSKHLETARMRLFDMWIDFVNLRSEEYTDNSRIPSMQRFGTPEEDAYRRDLTINSLFYNINTDSVEDFTKRGISDLKSGKIVTPLPPKATFLDDPLRVVRAIRFGARFEFTLDEDLKQAAACDEVKDALAAKISRERIGTEIDLMISGNQPVKAMTYICDLTIFWIVFSLPPTFEPAISDGCERLCISQLDISWNLIHLLGKTTFTDEQRRLTLYAAMFLPLRNTIYREKKAKKVPVVNYIFRESLKRKAKDPETVLDLHRASNKFLSLIPCLVSNEDVQIVGHDWMTELIDVPVSSRVRVLTGFLLRELRDFWRVALLISILLHPIDVNDTEDESSQLSKRRDLFNTVENSVIKLGLEKVWDVKQLINGKDVMSVLQLKGGPMVKEWLDKAMACNLPIPQELQRNVLIG
uniref:tRNA nucleotidyltransferase n=1 Tax=Lupinus albus TaxID=3870 RepID=Q42867_LUPAL|nr:tRNA nucleotidyltransferase [Lupinus albus]